MIFVQIYQLCFRHNSKPVLYQQSMLYFYEYCEIPIKFVVLYSWYTWETSHPEITHFLVTLLALSIKFLDIYLYEKFLH